MAVIRHHVPVLLRTTFSDEDLASGAMRLRPSDGDGVPDAEQALIAFLFVEQKGPGTVTLTLEASFGDGLWVPFALATLNADGAYSLDMEEVSPLPPYVRATATATVAEGETDKPTFAAIVRLGSNASLRAAPANVPELFVRTPTDDALLGNGGGA